MSLRTLASSPAPAPRALLCSDIKISQGSVATYLTCGGITSHLDDLFTTNFLLNVPEKDFEKLSISDEAATKM